MQIAEIRAVGGALIVQFLQCRRSGFRSPSDLEGRRVDVIPGQRAVARALADFVGIDERGQHDVRRDAAILRALAGDAIVLADGDVELTQLGLAAENRVVERMRILHRALAVGLLTDDERAAVVLNRAGENLRGRGAEAVHEHDHGAAVENRRIRIIVHFDAAGRVAQLHDRPAVDEQAGQRLGLGQVAAAIGAQIHDEHFGAVLAQLADQALHVAGGAAVILGAGAARVVILVEARHGDDADLDFARRCAPRCACALCEACASSDTRLRVNSTTFCAEPGRRAGGQQLQAHDGAARTADLLHHIIQAPADHIDELAGLAFADGGDAVVGGQLAADGGRAAGDDVDDRDVVVGRSAARRRCPRSSSSSECCIPRSCAPRNNSSADPSDSTKAFMNASNTSSGLLWSMRFATCS